MNRFFMFIALVVAIAVSSCAYDDTEVWDTLNDHEDRISKLEELCQQMNTNISSLQTIVNALQNNDYVTGVTPITENGKTIGYTITFAKAQSITIYHGKDGVDGEDGADGKDGTDGYTPIIGVAQDSDGIYYWTLDGEWLLDDAGNKIKAVGIDGKDGQDSADGADGSDGEDGKNGENGADGKDGVDGITPQLKIENDYWYISYDNGSTWTQLGKATGEDGKDGANGSNGADGKDGDSFFEGVDTSNDDYVVFTLADGTTIKIPTWYAFDQLKKQCEEMNQNITAMQQILEALQNNDYVTSVQQIVEDGKTIGYTIYFSKSGAVTIYHGENGKDGADGIDGVNGADGKDGHSPIVGVRQDSDGIYYWTLDGEWLTDVNGNKIKAVGIDGKDGQDGEDGKDGQDGTNGSDGTDGENGADGKDGVDGITPQLKIENEYWYISYDNGTTWTQLGKATGEDGKDGIDGVDGDSFFQDVTQDESNVYFTLADGMVITVPKGLALGIEFAESDLVVMSPNSTRQIGYTVTSATESVKVEVTSSADIKAKVVADNASGLTGKIHIATGATIDEYSKVIVFVSNGDKVIMRSITFEEAGLQVEENATKFATAEGGEMTLEFLSNVECEVVIPEEAQSWISVVPATRAMEKQTITLKLEPNEGAARSAEIMVKSVDGKLSLTYTITQEPDLDYQLALEREALIAIYNALDGDNWINNENWCSDKPVSEWYGVYTNGKNVTELYIKGQVASNSPKGIFPIEAENLHYLTKLHINGTNIDSFAEGLLFNNIEEVYFTNNVFLHLTELTPIYKSGNLKSFNIHSAYDYYEISETYKTPTPIPDELLNNKELQNLTLYHCNLSGEIPSKLWELENLKTLCIANRWESYLYGVIPPAIANLKNLQWLDFFNLKLTGGIPEELYTLTQLKYLSISSCYIGGQLSSNIQNLINLWFLGLEFCNLEGNLPEELAVLMDGDLEDCLLICNKLTGDIPDKIKNHSKWTTIWTSVVFDNQFNLTVDDVPAPVFDTNDVWGNRIISDDTYKNNNYTIIYGYDVGVFPYLSNAVYSCHEMHKLYNAYNKFGVDIVMIIDWGWEEQARQFITTNNIPWTTICYRPFGMTALPYIIIVDSTGKVVYTTILTNPSFDDVRAFFEEKFPNAFYTSTDYSTDGDVTTLQTATVGDGIDIVLMGDAYSDRQIADGTYEADMENLYNNLFTEEPYKSFKDHFNVHYVNVVSATEGYEYGNTALDGYFGDGTLVGGNDNAVFNYALNAISEDEMDEALLIVAMNSDNYAGTCYMYYPTYTTGTYGSGPSVAYFPKGGDATTFAQLLHHEACGHGFAKLADEYAYESMGAVPSDYVSQIQSQQNSWGWWKNVDFTSDPTATRWSHFINDTRYANEGLGAYEGGLTYWSGVWRPTENSIMRYNTGGFNAPSREAIYYRIHKLAYGDSWQYDYEEFVEWDARNRKSEALAARKAVKPANYKPTHPPVIVNKSWKDAK